MKFKYLLLVGLAASIGLASCGNNDDEENNNNEVTVAEVNAELDDLSTNAGDDIVDIAQTEGVQALEDLTNILTEVEFINVRQAGPQNNQEGNGLLAPIKEAHGQQLQAYKASLRSRIQKLRSTLVPAKHLPGNARIQTSADFQAAWGVYTFNPATEEFEQTNQEVQYVEYLFPTEGSTTNNASLRINDYDETSFEDDGGFGFTDTYYVPTLLDVTLSVDGTEVMAVDFTATWVDEETPSTLQASMTLVPYTVAVDFDDAGNTSTKITQSMLVNNETLLAVGVDVTFKSSAKEEPSQVDGFVQYRNIKIQGNADVAVLEETESVEDLNAALDLTMLLNDQKMGDIVIEEDANEEIGLFLLLSDGTKRDLVTDVLEPIIESIEDELDNL